MRNASAGSPVTWRLCAPAALIAAAFTATVVARQANPPQQPAPPATSAAEQQQQQQPPPRFRTEANYVRVDVYPTQGGKPVMDLQSEDFEVSENGARQSIQAFEHVVITPAGPQSLRVEPNSVRSGEQMAANPRNRVFVIFIDISHVAADSGYRITEPIIKLIDRMMGPDDLVAVMTAEMSAADITFARKSEVTAAMLRDTWMWGQRHRVMPHSEKEVLYESCYPNFAQQGLVEEMKLRRRERIVLDALHDLVRYLGSIREERKAILTISEGWALLGPNANVMAQKPTIEPIGVDPNGRLKVGGERDKTGNPAAMTDCERERMHLANMDNEQHFRDLLDAANRNNASFYPIDPRGLAVFDFPMGPSSKEPSISANMASLKNRIEVLRTMADATDGLAVMNTNNLDGVMKRIADDLTSYYLLGYYSTNSKLDGGYRRISVRVKKPGVDVRARRGYRAATAAELSKSSPAAAAPVPESVKTANAALLTLSRIRPDQRFSVHAIPVRDTSGGPVTGLWIAGELQMPLQEFAAGATATIELPGAAPASAVLKPGERAFLIKVAVPDATGAIDVRARLSAVNGPAVPLTEGTRVDSATGSAQPLLYRRGPSTGNRQQPAADFRFSRTERLRLELPIAVDVTLGSGRFLDRNAQPLQIPVQIAERQDPDGQRWLTADAVLSALGAGDYLIEVSYTAGGAEQQVLTAIRVTR
jgi:VWFA-related protein